MKLRIGSRESPLAVIQAERILEGIRKAHPEIELELVTMKTTGDKILDRTLDKTGGKGLFVRELELALAEGRVDLTVHSCKDLPMEENPALPLAAFSRREDPRDALVLPEGLREPDFSLPVGCSSLRRKAQLQALWPQARVEPVRGNVQTRLKKLEQGQFSALILAAAGLRRLGLEQRISRYFSVEEMLPAAGQGILAVQTRADFDRGLLSAVADQDSRDCAIAERAFVRRLDGGCSSPVAAYAVTEGNRLTLTGLYVDGQGNLRKGSLGGSRREAEALGTALAERLKED